MVGALNKIPSSVLGILIFHDPINLLNLAGHLPHPSYWFVCVWYCAMPVSEADAGFVGVSGFQASPSGWVEGSYSRWPRCARRGRGQRPARHHEVCVW
eukprot:1861359-Rhodomonas_salina.3